MITKKLISGFALLLICCSSTFSGQMTNHIETLKDKKYTEQMTIYIYLTSVSEPEDEALFLAITAESSRAPPPV